MSRACSVNPQVRVFFEELHDIPRFLTHSPQRIAVLDKVAGRNMPTRWNFNISTVNVVYDNRDCLIECMKHLEEDPDAVTCKEARGIRRILEDPNFTFWLTFFHYIMPHVDVLYNQLQKKNVDPIETQSAVNVFEQSINNVREKNRFNLSPPVNKKRKRPNNSKQDDRVACIEVCDTIINNAKERFAFTTHLVASSLLYSENFEKYNNKFPEDELNLTCAASAYGKAGWTKSSH
ncbi:hypothetical protein NQ317_013065 [Molorchus minor]|uniref:Uncharacterized protein n=1 Tax=Molorchus minor TaxID=1323400 RepID=A0ABQ9JSJ5_9CUCU|nr:hypothetical protein NQ317_013065 [Molorchus minor]